MHEGHELSKNIILDFFFSDVENTNVYHSKYYAPSITCITYKQILKTTIVFLMKIYDITIPLLLIIIVNIITLVIIKTQSIAQVFSYIVKASKFIDTYIVIKQVEFALINPGFHPVLLLILWFLQMFKITSTLASVSNYQSQSISKTNKQKKY